MEDQQKNITEQHIVNLPGGDLQDKSVVDFILFHADTNLIIAQRNSEWCGHGPILEQDIALTNISLDLLGQARNFYQYAAVLLNTVSRDNTVSEDTLAYLRTEREFKNILIAEQPNGDWAQTVLRQFLFSAWQYFYYGEMENSNNEQLTAIAAKALKEVTYHLRWSSEWVIRLGDGTQESHARMLIALEALWPYTGELFLPAPYESQMSDQGVAPQLSLIQSNWNERVNLVLQEACLPVPGKTFMHSGGKTGIHTENLGYILAELQYMQRTYPGCEW